MLMNQDGFTNHIADPEPAGKDLKVRFSSMGKQRRQVSRVAGVEDIPGIIMPFGIGKGFAAAVTALVNMESENRLTARFCSNGKSIDLNRHHNTSA